MSGKNNLDIGKICQTLNSHLKKKFGIGLEKTMLCTCDNEGWKDFLEKAGLESNYAGYYSPATRCAYIPEEHHLALQLLYHEYFGHGMYHEHTENGREMQRLETEIWWLSQELDGQKDVEEIERKKEQRDSLFENIRLDNEAFAVWMQYYLSQLTHKYDLFKKALAKTPVDVINAGVELIKLGKAEGAHAVFERYGMIKGR